MSLTLQTLKSAKKRGLTLIEALLFLGIAAIVIVAAVVLYNSTSNSQRTNDAITQIQAYSTGVKGLHSSVSSYGTASLDTTVINAGIAPANAVTASGTELVNPWGNGTTVIGNGSTFQILFETVPQDSCVRLLTAGLLSEGSITNIWVRPDAALPTSSQTPVVGTSGWNATTPPTPAQAAGACTAPNHNVYLQVR